MTIVSSYLTFPPISWWTMACSAETVMLDGWEHFQKMTYRNRYRISGANNPILLTVPLTSGREQHLPMREVAIYNHDRWQVQHWRTLVSVYRRTPYFDHYEHSLQPLFETPYTLLAQFNLAAMQWVKQQLRLPFTIQETQSYVGEYPPEITDIRNTKVTVSPPQYHQVFEDRIGFQPDLSILDLLFSEGPGAIQLLLK